MFQNHRKELYFAFLHMILFILSFNYCFSSVKNDFLYCIILFFECEYLQLVKIIVRSPDLLFLIQDGTYIFDQKPRKTSKKTIYDIIIIIIVYDNIM